VLWRIDLLFYKPKYLKSLKMKLKRKHFWIYSLAAIGFALLMTLGCEKDRFIDPAMSSRDMSGVFSSDINPLSIPDGERYLIGFFETPDIGLVKGAGGDVYRTFKIVPAVAARLSSQAAEALAKNPKVRYVELDHEVFAHGQTVPWGIDRVFGEESYSFGTWGITRGGGIAVAILDTGIDENHEDLPELLGGINTIDNTHWGSDGSGHGTHVAGTVAALDNNLGVVGVGPQIGLYAVKVLSDGGSGSVSSVAGGIDWAVEQGIPVLNMSLGSGSSSQTLKDACDAAYAKGHLLVASAGNNGNPGGRGDNVGYPGAYESVIAVAASTSNDSRASYSSTGPAVELIAPGSSILSTLPGDNYGTYSGTSMASPHVAGIAALVKAANPGLSNAEIRQILRDTAEDLGLSSNQQGYGLARADLAVRADEGVEPPPPAPTWTVSGTVTDGVGNALQGATVTIEGTGLSTTTGTDGSYSISNVEESIYNISASKSGYSSETINVNVDKDTTVDFVLKEEAETELSIDTFELTNTSNPAWGRVTVDWAVSGSNLSTVKSEMKLNGNVVDQQTSSVSGNQAGGTHELRHRGGAGTYDIVLTVTDANGKTVSETKQITL
jgi:subtilisin